MKSNGEKLECSLNIAFIFFPILSLGPSRQRRDIGPLARKKSNAIETLLGPTSPINYDPTF